MYDYFSAIKGFSERLFLITFFWSVLVTFLSLAGVIRFATDEEIDEKQKFSERKRLLRKKKFKKAVRRLIRKLERKHQVKAEAKVKGKVLVYKTENGKSKAA